MANTEKKYPYLGKCAINGKNYVVLFVKKAYGVIVQSDFTDNEKFAFGRLDKFEEDLFEYLDPEFCVRISN